MNMLKQVLSLVAVSVAILSLAEAQTGPGGVGSSTDNKLWLDAADASTKTLNVSNVSQWNDKSGNSNNATQGTAAKQPSNNLTGINSRETITFDGLLTANGDNLRLPDGSVLTSDGPLSFFTLMKTNDLTSYHVVYSAGGAGGYTAFETNGTKFNYFFSGSSGGDGSSTLTTGTTYVYEVHGSAATNTGFYGNGSFDSFVSNVTESAIPGGQLERMVGGVFNTDVYNWNGDLGEIIIYNRKLNNAERLIVGSCLASKWGVSYSSSKYSGSSSYSERVIGIGQESDGSNTSAKADGLTFTSNSSINANGEYLMGGHNAGANSVVTTDVVSSVTHRWSRIWYFTKTGTLDGGNVQIGFDFSDGGLGGTPATASNYRLLYRSGTSGNFSEVTTATSAIAGDNVNFTVIDANVAVGYYTIGTINNSSSPLPVQVSSLSAAAHSLGAELKWNTETEVNNYGFEIERRQSAESSQQKADTWQKVGFVAGSGTSSSPKEYSFVDRNLASGRYAYRIKQIDHDGTFQYHGNAEVEIGLTEKRFELESNYPNPFNPSTTIRFTLAEDAKTRLRVFNVLGEQVATLFDDVAQAGRLHEVTFDASSLPSGVYFSTLESGNQRVVKKMVLLR